MQHMPRECFDVRVPYFARVGINSYVLFSFSQLHSRVHIFLNRVPEGG